MSTNRQRAVTVATGVTTIAATVGGSVVGLATPAQALTAPVLNTKTCAAPNVATYNAAALAAYKKSPAWVKMNKATALALKKYKAAKTAAAKKVTKAAWLKAKAKQATALAAWTKLNTYSTFAGVATPAAVGIPVSSQPTHPGNWQWGTYTTRVLIKGGALRAVCTSVNEANAGNDQVPRQLASAQDKLDSASLYQGADKPMSTPVPGTLPVLWFAATVGAPKTAAASAAHVTKCATDNWNTVSAICPKAGLSDPVSGLTGATYTVNGFKQSLQKALTTAKANKKIG